MHFSADSRTSTAWRTSGSSALNTMRSSWTLLQAALHQVTRSSYTVSAVQPSRSLSRITRLPHIRAAGIPLQTLRHRRHTAGARALHMSKQHTQTSLVSTSLLD